MEMHVYSSVIRRFTPDTFNRIPANGTNETGSKFKANSKIQIKQPDRMLKAQDVLLDPLKGGSEKHNFALGV